MNGEHFRGGDELMVQYEITHRSAAIPADLYIALGVFGEYYFFPSWQPVPDRARIMLPSNAMHAQTVLQITLPAPLGSGGPFTFYAAITSPNSVELLAELSYWDFWFID